ncbi:hypothetical protein CR203_02275 [Salipaludibacillus neizhouensis]|uniref:YlbE-like protein n=1 Tax=Salipaludibacillus neizhouensis TaxID=885475 RepID=A0A3A9K8R4_9BACI|nr:YlbE-like family protein [Salipaludibacillus neizhouensis]RKL68887.1 hypothetical protein CR203_02275 [Salipaludibacillus neizhouensis]
MRRNVYERIKANPETHYYLRAHPNWYRNLGRDPDAYNKMISESNSYYGKTFPQRIDKLQSNMNLVMMMLDMMRQGNENV